MSSSSGTVIPISDHKIKATTKKIQLTNKEHKCVFENYEKVDGILTSNCAEVKTENDIRL